ncbi:ACE [Mytilus edulis]|uniref:Angiotensin-converting enzyme n=1 Tax=Mytilus edulis TaxID=6550 RepID=A0A8S3TWA5_MYTED|nr:ACE [Mytilus edulis]
MSGIYGNGKVCLSDDVCLKLEPGLYKILAESTDYDKLLAVWKGWRDACRVMKPKYVEYISISNKAIRELGYKDYGDYWRSHYDVPTFEEDLENLLKQLQPLYQNLHTYVRSKLMAVYGEDKFPESGHIPAHLLGNMWGQHWNNIYHLLVPFKNKEDIDVTQAMRDQGYTPKKMFEVAEEFFTSLGLEKMPATFWNDTIMVNPPGVEMVCHASAWDFIIKRTLVTMENLFVIHHEMGHIQYFLQYKNQPVKFREGANNGFHEAIGDVMALSVSTPEHLHKINLLDKVENDEAYTNHHDQLI